MKNKVGVLVLLALSVFSAGCCGWGWRCGGGPRWHRGGRRDWHRDR
ncbi:MAG TPA: hypothetical protein VH309_00560 [Elusimicrobiota bacterium]|jgi:hypothetical protein|nr:hypothetical protein [Elusimicrobiota bacterium]